jgi:DNA-binding transcriptional regulator YdaS (Cro superfamily)
LPAGAPVVHYVGMDANPAAQGGLDAAIKAAGGKAALARKLNRTKSVIGNWRRRDGGIPASVVPEAARVTGLPPHVLRPDLYDPPAPQQGEAA